jgi:hypothetical protein
MKFWADTLRMHEVIAIGLTTEEVADLVQYLKSL